jgi:hypothetical protein
MGVAGLLVALALSAQTTGRIDGRVVDPAGGPLGGATLTATSASLPGAQRATTDERGAFRILALPPGDYRVAVELDGYHRFEQGDVRVPLDGAVVLDLLLTPDFEERITVSDRAPVIDATSSARGVELPRELFETLPLARSAGLGVNPSTEGAITLANLAPGVTPGPQGAPFVAGSGPSENRYLVDVLDATDPHWGFAGLGFPFEFVEEVEVKTGGYGAEYGGALAGVINVLTRSGGNQTHGDLFGYYRGQIRQAGAFGEGPGYTEYDFGVNAGGRLIRDRLWYFVAWNPQSVESEDVSVQGTSVRDSLDAARVAGKLTWQASSAHQLNLSAYGKEYDQDSFDPASIGLHGHQRLRQAGTISAIWNGSFGSNLLVEAIAGRFAVDQSFHTLDDSAPAYLDLTGGRWALRQDCGGVSSPPRVGAVWFTPDCVGGDRIFERFNPSSSQLRMSATWLEGSHELKGGGSLVRKRMALSQHYQAPSTSPLVGADGVVVDPDGVAGMQFFLDPESYALEEFTTRGQP